nr:Carbamoyltransferase hypF [Klebsiella pneumoniae]
MKCCAAPGLRPGRAAAAARLGDIPPLLALGADMKNTFCPARGSEAVLSQHFGDLGEEGIEQQWRSALQLMQSIYAFVPQRVVVDAHPGYRSTQWAASCPCRWRQCCITMPTPRHAGGAPLAA